jgi:methylglutaconyl-CoA hydratase
MSSCVRYDVGEMHGMPEPLVIVHRDGFIATVTLNRPEARNALNRALLRQLRAVLAELAATNGIRALVLTGAGERAFCAGADLIERQSLTPGELTDHTAAINAVADAIADFPVPVIAAVRGYALAGGAELAIACDLRVAGEDAVVGYPEVKVGVFPGAGGVVRLPRLIGLGAARDLLYTGRPVTAHEALRLGLVERVVPPEQVLQAAHHLAAEIAANAPLAIRALKRALAESAGLPEPAAHRAVQAWREPLDATADYREGLAAFAEKRQPVFRGQ